jgi:hypothetical protein
MINNLVEDFFKWCGENDILDDTLFIISSDHGNFIAEHAYMLSSKERLVPLVFTGGTIGCHALENNASIIDIAANISYCLNYPYCAGSAGRVFDTLHSSLDTRTFKSRLGIIGHGGYIL